MRRRDHHYFVYMMASRTRVLYCGMTNSLDRRVEEHKTGTTPGFTSDYRCERLVWFERYQYVRNAIAREKEIKSWTRAKKLALIKEQNPSWADLSESVRGRRTADPSASLGMTKRGGQMRGREWLLKERAG